VSVDVVGAVGAVGGSAQALSATMSASDCRNADERVMVTRIEISRQVYRRCASVRAEMDDFAPGARFGQPRIRHSGAGQSGERSPTNGSSLPRRERHPR
jgi:hypothetical protein